MEIGFFDIEDRRNRLSELGDNLEALDKVIDWNMFLPIIKKALHKEHKGPGGRPPYDYKLMFKILVLQKYYNLSDEQTEFQITDRISFMRFLHLDLHDKVPDARTIWHFKNELAQNKDDVAKELFDLFEKMLEEKSLIAHEGSIVDATFADVPKQHNNHDDREALKEGKTPESWSEKKKAHKDTDAAYAAKRGEKHFGYKNHVVVDSESKFITLYGVTPASLPDFKALVMFFERLDSRLYGDSAYNIKPVLKELVEREIEACLNKGNTKGHKISDEDKTTNRELSRVRVRVEHVFGYIKTALNGLNQRSVGMLRNRFNIGLTNLLYNMCRYKFVRQTQG